MNAKTQEEWQAADRAKVVSDLEGEPLSSLRIEVAEMPDQNLLLVVTFGSRQETERAFAFSLENARVLGQGLLAACEQAAMVQRMLQAQRGKHAQSHQRRRK